MPTTFFSKLAEKLIKEACEKLKHDSEAADQGFGASYLRNLKLGAAKRQILVDLVAKLDPTQDSTPAIIFGDNDASSLANLRKILLEAESDVIKATKNPEFVGTSGAHPGQTELMLGGLIDVLPVILDRVKALNLLDHPYDANSAHLVFYFMMERFYAHMHTSIKFRERLKARDDKALPNPTPFAYAQKDLVKEVYDSSKPKIKKLLSSFVSNPLLPITEALLVKDILNALVNRHTVLSSVHSAQNDPMFMLFSEYLNNAEKVISRLASTDNISSDGHIETLSIRSGSISTSISLEPSSNARRTYAFVRDSAEIMQKGAFETLSRQDISEPSSLSSSPRLKEIVTPALNHQAGTSLADRTASSIQELNVDDAKNSDARHRQASTAATIATSSSTPENEPENEAETDDGAEKDNPFTGSDTSAAISANQEPPSSPAHLESEHTQCVTLENTQTLSPGSDLPSATPPVSATLLSAAQPTEEQPTKDAVNSLSSTAQVLQQLQPGGAVVAQDQEAENPQPPKNKLTKSQRKAAAQQRQQQEQEQQKQAGYNRANS